MATYTVKNGENLYDIALKLFGSVEGIFNLLVCNVDAISETGLSLHDTLKSGTVLAYTDTNSINAGVAKELLDINASVRNGEHLFEHYNSDIYIKTYVKKYNQEIIKSAFKLWPAMRVYSPNGVSSDIIESFLKYLNSYCIWNVQFTEFDIGVMINNDVVKRAIKLYPTIEQYPSEGVSDGVINDFLTYLNSHWAWSVEFARQDILNIVNGGYAKAERITSPNRLYVPKMIIKQQGFESRITYNMKKQSVMLIDWGDNKNVDMCVLASTRQEKEHCYDDSGEHTISIYGDFEFTLLNLSEIGGVYFPLSEIMVSGDFYTALPNDSIHNKLIKRT